MHAALRWHHAGTCLTTLSLAVLCLLQTTAQAQRLEMPGGVTASGGGGYRTSSGLDGDGPCFEGPWACDAHPAYPGPSTTFSVPLGPFCATPQKTCLLHQPAEVGLGCSCRAPAGQDRFRGMVVP